MALSSLANYIMTIIAAVNKGLNWPAVAVAVLPQLVDLSNGRFSRHELATLVAGIGGIKNPDNDCPIRGSYQ